MRRVPALALVLLLAGCIGSGQDTPLGPSPPSPDAALSMLEVDMDPAHAGGEPSLAVGPDGELYVCALSGLVAFATGPAGPNGMYRSSHLWRSLDDGATWTWLDPGPVAGVPVRLRGLAPGGGDCDVRVGRDGTVYLIDLTAAETSLAVSHDQGATWSWTTPAVGLPGNDRPWLATSGDADVYVAYHEVGTGLWVAHSSDRGMTFPDHWLALANTQRAFSGAPTNLVVSPDGSRLAIGWSDPKVIGVALSADSGETWRVATVTSVPNHDITPMPGLAMDDAGNLYMAWTLGDVNGPRVVVSRSSDDGATWSEHFHVTDGTAREALPWVAAGGAGNIAVSFARQIGKDWTVHLAVSVDALNATPRFIEAQASQAPALTGGLARPLADFFQDAVLGNGRAGVVWTSNVAGEGFRMHFARQETGPLLRSGAPL